MTTARPTPFPASTVLGYPRIGPDRELKRALEGYWQGGVGLRELRATGAELRERTWRRLAELGLAGLPSNTFSFYDHVLDTAIMVDAVPGGHRRPSAEDTCFAMARGAGGIAPLRMTKWFDTNYHYIVPSIGPGTAFRAVCDKPVAEVRQARALGLTTRPVLLGPVTFLLLSQPEAAAPAGFRPLERLGDLLEVYERVLATLAAEGVEWVQLDEPALVADRTAAELDAAGEAYRRLGSLKARPAMLVASYFGELGPALPVLARTPVEAIGLDLVAGAAGLEAACRTPELAGKTVVAGVVGGREVWRTDGRRAMAALLALRGRAAQVVVSTSCSLLHLPYDVERETGLDPRLRARLAFAEQKVAEVVELAERLARTPAAAAPPHPAPPPAAGAAEAAAHAAPASVTGASAAVVP
ncbi:5-methyltetrahydropteroyltriglutamate--homocysteine S-methyltransferase, partial [Sphaerisporangium dianthi]